MGNKEGKKQTITYNPLEMAVSLLNLPPKARAKSLALVKKKKRSFHKKVVAQLNKLREEREIYERRQAAQRAIREAENDTIRELADTARKTESNTRTVDTESVKPGTVDTESVKPGITTQDTTDITTTTEAGERAND